MYFVGKIEDGIKKEKIMDNGVSILEKKMIIFDEHVQAMTKERGSKRKSRMTQDEPVKNFFHLSLYTQVPLLVHLHLGCPFGKMFEGTTQVAFKVIRGKKTKMYHSLPISYGELLPILT